MSVKVLGRVWDTALPPNQRLVLLAYADAAEHDGTRSFPGEERLSDMTGYSRSQVQRITTELVKLGVLVRVKPGFRGQRAEFAVDLDALNALSMTSDGYLRGPVKVSQHATHEVSQSATQSKSDSVASDNAKGSHPTFER
mgnify:CR=1 FL=1